MKTSEKTLYQSAQSGHLKEMFWSSDLLNVSSWQWVTRSPHPRPQHTHPSTLSEVALGANKPIMRTLIILSVVLEQIDGSLKLVETKGEYSVWASWHYPFLVSSETGFRLTFRSSCAGTCVVWHLPTPPDSSHFYRPNLASVYTPYLLFLEHTFSFFSTSLCFF